MDTGEKPLRFEVVAFGKLCSISGSINYLHYILNCRFLQLKVGFLESTFIYTFEEVLFGILKYPIIFDKCKDNFPLPWSTPGKIFE